MLCVLLQGLDTQKQQPLHDGARALSACDVGEGEISSTSSPNSVCEREGLQEGVSEGEEAEPLQDVDEYAVHTPLKVCPVKLMDYRTTLNTHITKEEEDDTGDGVYR